MAAVARIGRKAVGARSMLPLGTALQRRGLSLHEYQSLQVFQGFGVAVPKTDFAKTVEEATQKAKAFGDGDVVIKAQVLAGGRGLGHFKENNFKGGVHICPVSEVGTIAEKMLGKTLVTKQTTG